jgi:glycosyltransferase involved in cell wall biosynthesis
VKQGSYSIAILTDYMLHPTLDRFLPVEENLGLLKLIRFIRDELSWQVDVFQASPIPQRVFDGVRVFGIDQDPDHLSMFPGLNSVFARRSLGYDLRIYYHWHLAAPKVCHNSVVVSHGIFWDAPSTRFNRLHSIDRKEWEKRLLYGVSAPRVFVAEDRNTINVIKAMWPGYEHKIEYIPPGIDLDAFSGLGLRAEPAGESDTVRIICPQDFTMEQGINEVLTVAGMAWERGANMEFCIGGHMTDTKQASIMAEHISSLPNLKLCYVHLDSMADLYPEFDIALMPSRGTQGASLYCLMAMACGLPVIAGFAGGLAEHVVHGWNGYLLYPAVANVFQALLELAGNEGLRRRMGENARKLAEGYPESLWKQRWTCLLKRILAKPLKCNAPERR